MSERDGMKAWGAGALPEIMMDLLTPHLADISADGLSLTGDVTADEIGLTGADTQLEGSLAVGLDLTKFERTICVTGVVEGTAIRECVRCLAPFPEPLAFALRVVYEPEPKAVPPAAKRIDHRKRAVEPVEAEPDETDDEIYHYGGDHLELAPMLREQVILSDPMHPLCKPDCAGLCPQCGKNLNDGRCACQEEAPANPFQALKSLKTEQK
ncbi:MAG: hypothetical protein LZF86_110686 [Nitrospira sp.]|nr:MAG: hypothetical protein LZF86_110686 [Nitrospira sp.]